MYTSATETGYTDSKPIIHAIFSFLTDTLSGVFLAHIGHNMIRLKHLTYSKCNGVLKSHILVIIHKV